MRGTPWRAGGPAGLSAVILGASPAEGPPLELPSQAPSLTVPCSSSLFKKASTKVQVCKTLLLLKLQSVLDLLQAHVWLSFSPPLSLCSNVTSSVKVTPLKLPFSLLSHYLTLNPHLSFPLFTRKALITSLHCVDQHSARM